MPDSGPARSSSPAAGTEPHGDDEERRDADERRGMNPLRSEGEAFRFLLWVLAVFVVAVAIVLIVRAVT